MTTRAEAIVRTFQEYDAETRARGPVVYITATATNPNGARLIYHRRRTRCGHMRESLPISLSRALAMGASPCLCCCRWAR